MSEHLSPPEFNARDYERPHLKWTCGRAAEGAPCRNGPSATGGCGADFECSPALEKKAGENKGHFRCTRPQERGGPCAHGPRPDGACGRPVAPCAPVRSLRSHRARATWFAVGLTAALLLIGLGGPWRGGIINPGELSWQHSSAGFLQMAGDTNGQSGGCAACHRVAGAGLAGWTEATLRNKPGPLDFEAFSAEAPPSMASIEAGCLHCHPQQREPHQPNVVDPPSCVACHAEHRGRSALARADPAHCVACHSDAHAMLAAAVKGRSLPAHQFERPLASNLVLFKPPRTAAGYLRPFKAFWDGHPELQILREERRETNTLRFNHQLHLGETVRRSDGSRLQCQSCHPADVSGNFRQNVTFNAHCRECHAVQFDSRHPDLAVPHGDPSTVHAYVGSLRTQYADAARRRGHRDEAAVRRYVEQQEQTLLRDFVSAQALEERIFFGSKRRTGSHFDGCILCHEIAPAGESLPRVTKPVIPDRWLFHSTFDHRQHAAVACAKCHAAETSRDTADILMPRMASCTECHRPGGGARHDCLACHQYHRQPAELVQEHLLKGKALASERDH